MFDDALSAKLDSECVSAYLQNDPVPFFGGHFQCMVSHHFLTLHMHIKCSHTYMYILQTYVHTLESYKCVQCSCSPNIVTQQYLHRISMYM